MAIGPVQLIVLGFDDPQFHDEVAAELESLRRNDAVRVIDALAVYKDRLGEVEVEHLTGPPEAPGEVGRRISTLVGLGTETEEEALDVVADIPNDSAAAIILLEHHWAVPLWDAIVDAGGFRLSDGFISPLDLVDVGLLSAEDADQLRGPEVPPRTNAA
jgi:hypothetical protein